MFSTRSVYRQVLSYDYSIPSIYTDIKYKNKCVINRSLLKVLKHERAIALSTENLVSERYDILSRSLSSGIIP